MATQSEGERSGNSTENGKSEGGSGSGTGFLSATRGTRFVALVGICCLVAAIGFVAASGLATADPATGQTATEIAAPQPVLAEQPGFADRQVLADQHVGECAAESPDDYAPPEEGTAGTVGYVDGYWYDQPLDIDNNDPLNAEELRNLTLRTAARVEALRCYTFQEVPPLEFVTRDEYRTDLESFYEEQWNESDRRFANAQLATMLVAGQSRDAMEVQIENQAAFPAAFYDLEEEFMGFVTNDPDNITLQETTLAHELTHALEDQHFDLQETFNESTNDQLLSSMSVVEGNADLIQEQYDSNCNAGMGWDDSCITEQTNPGEPPNWGLTLNQLAVYNTPLVADTYEAEGWDGVDSLLQNKPDSMIESIYPDRYGEFQRADITVEDTSSDAWNRLEYEGPGYDILGQSALTAILMAPYYESGGQEQVILATAFFNEHSGGPVDYGHPATDGWQADRMYGYTNGEDNGAVWEFAWDSSETAEEFAGTFAQLVEYRGGATTDDYANVYTFESSDEYDMAMAIDQDGDHLTVVMAPSVAELSEVHSAVEFEAADDDDGSDGNDGDGTDGDGDGTDGDGDGDGTDGDGDGTDGDGTDGDVNGDTDGNDSDGGDGEDADDGGPGFGVLIALLAVISCVLAIRLRS